MVLEGVAEMKFYTVSKTGSWCWEDRWYAIRLNHSNTQWVFSFLLFATGRFSVTPNLRGQKEKLFRVETATTRKIVMELGSDDLVADRTGLFGPPHRGWNAKVHVDARCIEKGRTLIHHEQLSKLQILAAIANSLKQDPSKWFSVLHIVVQGATRKQCRKLVQGSRTTTQISFSLHRRIRLKIEQDMLQRQLLLVQMCRKQTRSVFCSLLNDKRGRCEDQTPQKAVVDSMSNTRKSRETTSIGEETSMREVHTIL